MQAKLLHSQAEGMRAEAATSDEAKLALKANAAQMRIEAAEMLKPRDSNPHEHQVCYGTLGTPGAWL